MPPLRGMSKSSISFSGDSMNADDGHLGDLFNALKSICKERKFQKTIENPMITLAS